MTAYVVYWVYKPDHTDMVKEGYIGVTSDFKRRMWDHHVKSKTVDNVFQRAIRKYGWGNLDKRVIFEGTKEECQSKERELRPTEYIGWNVCVGGFIPKSPTPEQRAATSARCKGKPGTPHTTEFKEKLSERNKIYTYTIIKPDGSIEVINCLSDWCTLNGIRQNCMQRVASGKRKQHKGYSCTRVTN